MKVILTFKDGTTLEPKRIKFDAAGGTVVVDGVPLDDDSVASMEFVMEPAQP